MKPGERTRLERRLRRLEAMAHPSVPIEDVVDEVLMRRDLIPRPPEHLRCPKCGLPNDDTTRNTVGNPVAWHCSLCDIDLAPDL